MSVSKNTIYNSIFHIEGRLSDELNIKELAGQAYFSKTHYKRLFQSVMGEAVMEYVKKRRLQRACISLSESSMSILDIALQYGYTSHEGFTRAFKAHFKMSPTQYRRRYSGKNIKPYHKEVKKMITNESRKKIAQHSGDIAKELDELKASLEKCAAAARKEVEKSGQYALGIKVALGEWEHLSGRISSARHELISSSAEAENVYDLFSRTDNIVKTFDNIAFQMNLLRFMTGVELSRMGEHGIPFKPVLEGLTDLSKTDDARKQTTLKLINELKLQVQAEICSEAATIIQQGSEVLREAVSEGASLSEKLNTLVINLGPYGRGFSAIAEEMEKACTVVRNAEAFFTNLSDKMQAASDTSFPEPDKTLPQIACIEYAAFKINVNAFNAAVEAARSGEREDAAECAKGVIDYAAQLQRANKTCVNAYNDFTRLIDLLSDKAETGNQNLSKQLDDLIFLISILNTQLSLEARRSSRDNLIELSRDFEKAFELLNQNRQRADAEAVTTFEKNLAELMKRGISEAEAAGDHGVGIAYILNEYKALAMPQK